MKPPLQFPTQRHDAHASFTFTAGIVFCRPIRKYLQECKLDGLDLEWMEGRGWLRRDWSVRGATAAVEMFQAELKELRDNRARRS